MGKGNNIGSPIKKLIVASQGFVTKFTIITSAQELLND